MGRKRTLGQIHILVSRRAEKRPFAYEVEGESANDLGKSGAGYGRVWVWTIKRTANG
jgi:hypothetical protein